MSNKTKILFFIESLGCGGAEKSLVSLLGLLDYDKVQVDVMIAHEDMALAQYLPKEVRLLRVSERSKNGIPSKARNFIYSVKWRLNKKIGRKVHHAELFWSTKSKNFKRLDQKYDIAIAYQQGLPTYYIADKVMADRKLAWINIDLSKAGYSPKYNSKFYTKYDKAVAVSEELHNTLKDNAYVDKAKVVTIYDILNEDFIRQMSEQEIDFKEAEPRLQLVTVGRLAPQKNYPLAISTAQILKSRGLKFRWAFVGEGGQWYALKEMIKEKGVEDCVYMAGLQINPYPYMKAADIYVQTSSFEGFGLTIAEAKILHKPVVSTNFTVVYDQITDGINGLISEMTPESLAEKIMMIADDPDLRESLIDATKMESNTTAHTEVQKFYKLIGVQ